MNSLKDAEQRKQALDTSQSFIVQAPAGSGKTELLTQRFLALLSQVQGPEEILAITFTKKSAAEMRSRIMNSLMNPSSPLAQKALARDQQLDWNLLNNPNRLQIQTIDSFNAGLTRQLPLLSHFGGKIEITDDAFLLYQEAVFDLLSHLEENVPWSAAIETLLVHLDNDLDKLAELLVHMLSKRDQWLQHIIHSHSAEELRTQLEQNLADIVVDTLQLLQQHFPKHLIYTLLELLQFSSEHLPFDTNWHNLKLCRDLRQLPGSSLADKSLWLGIFELLITYDKQKHKAEWRKRIDKNLGFPPECKQQKKLMEGLLETLQSHETLKLLFEELIHLPEAVYDHQQWKVLHALQEVLRMSAAQLKIIFQKYGKIDYIENALAALSALGPEDRPTDITLALDYKIKHILIDEFQDTAAAQYRLLEKLIAGWQPGDGRTLFLVGDPMQSIYRFREAEVGLFMRAQKHGIQGFRLHPLQLSMNFRSISPIVEWINQHFSSVFPAEENIAKGAVVFTPSTAVQTISGPHNAVQLHPFVDAMPHAQADKIVALIQQSRKRHPEAKIAVLVRSRSHLIDIIPALKNANLAFRALDIDPLTERPVIQDLLALTHALLFLHDRVAWLAILRAPWCGLALKDLLVIAGDKSKPILWEQLQNHEIIQQLTAEGQVRLQRTIQILKISLAERRRYTLREWVEYTWLQLGGPACYLSSDLDDAAAYFRLLENDFEELPYAIKKLFAAPQQDATELLQVMTIHNAKGLEFDVVILPHLERAPAHDDKRLLQWFECPRSDDRSALLLAPIHAIGEASDAIYDYIRRQHHIKSNYENGRLLYVAATRAKKELHMLFDTASSGNSLLKLLWPSIENEISTDLSSVSQQIPAEKKPPSLKRLALSWQTPLQENKFSLSARHQNRPEFNLPDHTAALVGTLVHRILQNISLHSTVSENFITQQLVQLGVSREKLIEAATLVHRAITTTLQDPRGQWILQPHAELKTEYALTAVIQGKTKHVVIDRTFIDENGVRWIIDYKSTALVDKDRYMTQLREYIQVMQYLEKRSVRAGLYFPLLPEWIEVEN